MGKILPVNRLTVKSKTVHSYLDIAQGRTNEAWVALLSGLPGTCCSPTAGGGRYQSDDREAPLLPAVVFQH